MQLLMYTLLQGSLACRILLVDGLFCIACELTDVSIKRRVLLLSEIPVPCALVLIGNLAVSYSQIEVSGLRGRNIS
jgi:hypothetical protein